ncbi:amidase-like [Liolophura sinensis]|uniref:amidase-like n=1 Tax=Liolophura sinensis TaxID=3198878 RepID=UPI0031592EC2
MGDRKADLWHSPAVHPLSKEKVKEIADSLNLGCSSEEIDVYTAHYRESLKSYQRVHELVEPALPVRYPRTPGYRPKPEENTHNAWYYKCDIKGAATGKLSGKRVGIKDNTAVAGVPMMNGSKIMEGYVPEFDATIVTRILDAGGHIIGKTACEDVCLSAGGFNNAMAPVLNPAKKDHLTSGSSSGSAVLLATGEIDLASGGDQSGSIRLPACWCGIVGLKPTYGLVPYTGCMPIDMTIDHCGPMARSVYDCALMLEVLAGYDDGRDPRQHPNTTVPEYTKLLSEDLSGKRVGLVKEGFEICEQDVNDIVRAAAKMLIGAGAAVEEVSIPAHKDGIHIWTPIGFEGAYQTMISDNVYLLVFVLLTVNCIYASYISAYSVGWKGQHFPSLLDKLGQACATRSLDYSEGVRSRMILADYMTKDYHGRFYAKAQNLGRWLTNEYNKALADYDVLIMPTIPYKAPKIPRDDITVAERISVSLSLIPNTAPFNISGHPSLSVNAGHSNGLPIGMMITGRSFDDATVLQVAYAFERLRDKTKGTKK